jgi:3-oxoacyl-[acyl-carrier protein] reductase
MPGLADRCTCAAGRHRSRRLAGGTLQGNVAGGRQCPLRGVPCVDADAIQPEVADAGDPTVPASILDRYEPAAVILVAGAPPHMRPLQQQTWETFSVNWNTDVRITFHWLREALLTPLRPGSKVVVVSSGAAVNPNGSPLSGGYAGAKATQRLITGYAQDEAALAGLDITFTTVLPKFAPMTGVGRPAVRAYAAQAGQTVDDFLQSQPPQLTPEIADTALVELVQADAATLAPAANREYADELARRAWAANDITWDIFSIPDSSSACSATSAVWKSSSSAAPQVPPALPRSPTPVCLLRPSEYFSRCGSRRGRARWAA